MGMQSQIIMGTALRAGGDTPLMRVSGLACAGEPPDSGWAVLAPHHARLPARQPDALGRQLLFVEQPGAISGDAERRAALRSSEPPPLLA